MAELHAFVLSISGPPPAGRPQCLLQQRAAARRALTLCAEQWKLGPVQWLQDANRVPLPCGPYHWSISHKPRMAAAVIDTTPVGIDVERVIPRRNTDLWERVAKPREWTVIGGPAWETFYRIWTAKEAVLKANGRGIGYLDRCSLIDRFGTDDLLLRYEDRTWPVRQSRFGEHMAAVTLRAFEQSVRWHRV